MPVAVKAQSLSFLLVSPSAFINSVYIPFLWYFSASAHSWRWPHPFAIRAICMTRQRGGFQFAATLTANSGALLRLPWSVATVGSSPESGQADHKTRLVWK